MMKMVVGIIIMVIGACNAQINDPVKFSLPSSIGSTFDVRQGGDATTLLVSTSLATIALSSPLDQQSSMNIITTNNYSSRGIAKCVYVNGDRTIMGVISQWYGTSLSFNYTIYDIRVPSSFTMVYQVVFKLDSDAITCEHTESLSYTDTSSQLRPGFHIATSTTLYFVSQNRMTGIPECDSRGIFQAPSLSSTMNNTHGCNGTDGNGNNGARQWSAIITAAGNEESQGQPRLLITTQVATVPSSPLITYRIDAPSLLRTNQLLPDEQGVQIVSLDPRYTGTRFPSSSGWLITTLTNRQGIRVQPWDFESFDRYYAEVEKSTIASSATGSIHVARIGACTVMVGDEFNSSPDKPIATLTLWFGGSPIGRPQVVDRKFFKLAAGSNGIKHITGYGIPGDRAAYVYAIDDITVYRFQTRCPAA